MNTPTRAGEARLASPGWFGLVALLAGLLITLSLAASAQNAAVKERELTFGREAEAVQQRLVARVEELSNEFRSAANFIGSTHPGPSGEFADYFTRSSELATGVDPGVLFVEEVERARLNDLVVRERIFGNAAFAVRTRDTYPSDWPAYVVTRVAAEINPDFPLIGFDIVVARGLLLPSDEEIAEDGYVLRIADSSLLLSIADFGTNSDESSEVVWADGDVPTITPFFVGVVRDADGERLGWAVRFLNPDLLSDHIEPAISAKMNVRLSVAEANSPIAQAPAVPATAAEDAELHEERSFETASQTWTMAVWADPDYQPTAGIFGQLRLWIGGAGLSVGLAVVAGGWSYYRRRLVGSNFELAHVRILAMTDPLTGLLNRQGFIDTARDRSDGSGATVFFIDLDGFKSVNDERGHEAGDVVLASVSAVLRAIFRHDDLIGRLGGDEFVVFTQGSSHGANARRVAERIVAAIDEVDVAIGCSVGIAHRPPSDATDVKDLVRYADEAMYSAKGRGGNQCVISST